MKLRQEIRFSEHWSSNKERLNTFLMRKKRIGKFFLNPGKRQCGSLSQNLWASNQRIFAGVSIRMKNVPFIANAQRIWNTSSHSGLKNSGDLPIAQIMIFLNMN